MKVIAFNGSPRPGGNTAILIDHALAPLKAAGIQTEVVQIGGGNIHGAGRATAASRRKMGAARLTTTWPTA